MLNIHYYTVPTKKLLLILVIFTTSLTNCFGQGVVTPINAFTLGLNAASEGDYYIGTEDPIGLIYIGLQNGEYQPIFKKGLSEIMFINNDASSNKIIDLVDPVNPQDIATRAYVLSKNGESIYEANGNLISHRVLSGAAFTLTYGNISAYSNQTNIYNLTASTNVNFSANLNILNSSTVIKENLAVSGVYLDSDKNPGTLGQLLSSTNIGTKWITSSVSPKTINYYSSESAKTFPSPELFYETWPSTSTKVGPTHSVVVTEKSIVSINYTFTFFIDPNLQEGDRITYITIKNPDGSIAFDHFALNRIKPLKSTSDNSAIQFQGTNYGTKKVILTTPGTYSFELITLGDMPVNTGMNSFNSIITNAPYNNTGWSFDISVIPQQI